ncbi:hypothetical protein [Amycolatopsis sp. SID8362]|uniref:hypothetical protein n=1 Tax=Amycolatopsis sp. SID8362 TaxID=2690346 RepID=UPI001369F4A1|nr:hypothetical protein [Amycolatopsis sp. SID8362]NBH02341.1 hypothetical protein [Amycolatopsis sp. SID8362]NED39044.1 hypothetical protein [Amycolatopsis sp. SID8362]
MTTIVKGHGGDPDGDDTFVPDGQTVRTYTAHTVNLDQSISLFAMLDGAGQPGRKITGPIKNYQLARQDDKLVAQWTALAADSNAEILWVGSDLRHDIRLCGHDNPGRTTELCYEAGEHTCLDGTTREHATPREVVEPRCERLGRHICSGVLGHLPPERVDDIVLVACLGEAPTFRKGLPGQRRGKAYNDIEKPELHVDTDYDFTRAQFEGQPVRRNPATSSAAAVPVDPVDPDDAPVAYVWRRIGKRPADRAAIAEAEAYVDRLPPATTSLLLTYPDIVDWLNARWVKIYAEQNQLDQLVGQLASYIARIWKVMNWLEQVPWYGDIFDRACLSDRDELWRRVNALEDGVAAELKNAIVVGREAMLFDPPSAAHASSGIPAWEGAQMVYEAARDGDLPYAFELLEAGVGVPGSVLDQFVTKPGYGQTLDTAAQQNLAEFWERFSNANPAVQQGLLGRDVLRELLDQRFWTLLTSGNAAQAETDIDGLPEETCAALFPTSTWLSAWQCVRTMTYYANQDDIDQLFQALRDSAGDFDIVLDIINTVPAYRQALDETAGRNNDKFAAELQNADEPIGDKLRENFSWAT